VSATFVAPTVALAGAAPATAAPVRKTPPKPKPAPKPAPKPKAKAAPKGARFLCKDGTYSFVKSARTACVGHRGVQRAL
jgi:hypothetical protein